MSKISLAPDASGTGIFTIASPNSNTNRTLTLPDDTGTIVTNSGNQAGSFTTLNTSGQVVFNDAGADVDFRVEGDTDASLLFVDASADAVTIGTSVPSGNGKLTIKQDSDTTDGGLILLATDNNGAGISRLTDGGLTFRNGGLERMRIESGGNLLIGRTNTTIANNTGTIITPTFTSIASNSNGTLFLRNCSPTVSANIGGLLRFDAVYRDSDSDVTDIAGVAGLRESASSGNFAGYLAFSTTPNGGTRTERMRIDSSGNVGIGTSSPATKLVVSRGGGADYVTSFTQTGSGVKNGLYLFNDSTSDLSNPVYGMMVVNAAGASAAGYRFWGALGASNFLGAISQSGTTGLTYGTNSDYRLKENIAPMTGALAKVLELNPVTYTWKLDGSVGQGFIAHELQAVVPECVSGEKDAMQISKVEISPAIPATFDNDGNELTPAIEAVYEEQEIPSYQNVDTSFLVATLTAAIQELKAELDEAKTRIAALEAN